MVRQAHHDTHMHSESPSPHWWTRNIRTTIYFIRELTGPVIAFYFLYFLIAATFDTSLKFTNAAAFHVISWIGLTAAVFHTITWL